MKNMDANSLYKSINTILEKIANSRLQREDLTLSQWRYLNYIYHRGGKDIYMKDIEYHFDVSAPTVAGIIKRIKAKGYIIVEKSDYAANSKSISLTPAGTKLCESGQKDKNYLDNLLTAPLNDDEKEELNRLLQKIYKFLKEIS